MESLGALDPCPGEFKTVDYTFAKVIFTKEVLTMKARLWVVLCLFQLLVAQALATTYEIDKDHSSITFKIRHIIGKVQGRFDTFSGTIQMEANKLGDLKTEATIETTSINTNVAPRDKHLRSEDFFDVANKK